MAIWRRPNHCLVTFIVAVPPADSATIASTYYLSFQISRQGISDDHPIHWWYSTRNYVVSWANRKCRVCKASVSPLVYNWFISSYVWWIHTWYIRCFFSYIYMNSVYWNALLNIEMHILFSRLTVTHRYEWGFAREQTHIRNWELISENSKWIYYVCQ